MRALTASLSTSLLTTAILLQDLRGKHKIIPNGYNIGRDWVVEQAVKGTWYLNRRYSAQVEWIDGLLEPGNEGASASLIVLENGLTCCNSRHCSRHRARRASRPSHRSAVLDYRASSLCIALPPSLIADARSCQV